jgi:hypothetical protein
MANTCTYIDGIGSSQVIDSSGEIVDISGLDCSSLIGGAFNYEHKSDLPSQLVGKVLDYKKIFSEKDCDTDRQKHFWKKVKAPFLYVMGRLFDDRKDSSKEVAALIKDDADHPNEKPMIGFSVEGNKLPGAKEGMTITHSIARKITLTNLPCNKTCVAELMPKKSDKSKKDDFDSLFKGEVEFFAPEPSYLEFLEKKEQILKKSTPVAPAAAPKAPLVPQGWKAFKSNHPLVGDVVGFKHGQHGAVTVHKDSESGKYHVNHRGAQAGVMGKKGVFDKPAEALAHAAKYVNAYHKGKVLGRGTHGDPMAKSEEPPKKPIWEDKHHAVYNAHSHNASVPNQHKVYDPDASETRHETSKDVGFNYRIHPDHDLLHLVDKKNNKVVGHMAIEHGDKGPQVRSVHVDTERAGHGTKLYQAALKEHGKNLKPDEAQEPGDKAIWNKIKAGKLHKSLEAGSGMGAPSTLTQGAALAKEDLAKTMFTSPTGERIPAKELQQPNITPKANKAKNWGHKPGEYSPKGQAGTSIGQGESVREGDMHGAKDAAKRALNYQRRQPKPKLTKSETLLRAEQAYNTWGKKEEFEKFMSNRWPHFTKGEIKAFGHAIMLGKSLDAESNLAKMMGSFYEKSEEVPASKNECNEK